MILSTLLSLFFAISNAAQSGLQPAQHSFERIEDSRRIMLFRQSRSSQTLSDGTEWVTHPCPARKEPGCIAVTRLLNGKATTFLAADFLPGAPGHTVPIGSGGQVYSVAALDDGTQAVSLGWNDGHDSHNAIVFLVSTGDRYTSARVVELPCVRAIAAGPDGTVLAITSNASVRGGGPRLTLLDSQGTILGSWFDGDPSATPAQAARLASSLRLEKIASGRYTFFDPAVALLRVFNIDGTNPSTRAMNLPNFVQARKGAASAAMTPLAAISLNDDLTGQFVLDVHTTPHLVTSVTTVGSIDGQPRTRVTLYDTNGGVSGRWVSEHPWRHAEHHGNVLTGVVDRDDLWTESVTFRELE
jgi:uncharacterized protein YodC (DUF2158 family)